MNNLAGDELELLKDILDQYPSYVEEALLEGGVTDLAIRADARRYIALVNALRAKLFG